MVRTVDKQYWQYKQVQCSYVRATVMQSNKFIINGTLFLEIVEKHGIVTAPDLHEKNKQINSSNTQCKLQFTKLVSSSVLWGYKFFSYQERKRHLFVSGHLTECAIKTPLLFYLFIYLFSICYYFLLPFSVFILHSNYRHSLSNKLNPATSQTFCGPLG